MKIKDEKQRFFIFFPRFGFVKKGGDTLVHLVAARGCSRHFFHKKILNFFEFFITPLRFLNWNNLYYSWRGFFFKFKKKHINTHTHTTIAESIEYYEQIFMLIFVAVIDNLLNFEHFTVKVKHKRKKKNTNIYFIL